MTHKRGYFNLKNCLEKVCSLIEPQLISKNVQIIKNIDDIMVYGFENEFIQVIINILNNSKDEFEKIVIEEKIILIDTKVIKNRISICIKDNAGGIVTGKRIDTLS